MEFDTAITPRGIQNLQINPDRFPHATLKAFNEFIEQWVLVRSKISWISETCNWSLYYKKKKGISKDKVRKLLGFFATTRLVQDWKAAEPNKVLLKDCTWDLFLKKTLIILQTKEKSYNMKSRIQAISSSQKLNF